jgi:hypothetical protein
MKQLIHSLKRAKELLQTVLMLVLVAFIMALMLAVIAKPTPAHAESLAWQSYTNSVSIAASTNITATTLFSEVSAVRKRSTLVIHNPNGFSIRAKLGATLTTNDNNYVLIPAGATVPLLNGGTEYQGAVVVRSNVTNDSPTAAGFQGGF